MRQFTNCAGQLGAWTRTQCAQPPWTATYGVARSLIALGLMGTLLLTTPGALFSPGQGVVATAACSGWKHASLFCLAGTAHHEAMVWPAVAILVLVVIGWRPRWTGPLHWWVAASFLATATIQDGGDQAAVALTFLLIPVTVTDPRRWHWQSPPGDTTDLQRVVGHLGMFLVCVQVAVIYLDSGIAKLGVTDWFNGTALYYILLSPTFGVPLWVHPFVHAILAHSIIVTLLTWTVPVLEVGIGLSILGPKWLRRALFPLGLLFHLAIAVVMGLVSFSLSMSGALVLLLVPIDSHHIAKVVERVDRRRSFRTTNPLIAGTRL